MSKFDYDVCCGPRRDSHRKPFRDKSNYKDFCKYDRNYDTPEQTSPKAEVEANPNSPYGIAVADGYSGTEEEFNTLMSTLPEISDTVTDHEVRIKALETAQSSAAANTGTSTTTGGSSATYTTVLWEIYYIYSGSPIINNYKIPLESFDGWDSSMKLTDDMYYDSDLASQFEMWANNPGEDGSGAETSYNESDATKVPFDGGGQNPSSAGTLEQWGYDGDTGANGSIVITGSSAGFSIPIKLTKLG